MTILMTGSKKRNENLSSQSKGLKKRKAKTAPQGGKVEGKVGYLPNSHGRQKLFPLLVRTTAFHKTHTLERFSNEVESHFVSFQFLIEKEIVDGS